MSTVQIMQDGVLVSVDSSQAPQPVPSATAPQTVFSPDELITTLFTPAEQIGFTSKPQGVLFMGLIAGASSIDITSATFKADIAQAVAGGFLTQDRANQVLAGTPAPQPPSS